MFMDNFVVKFELLFTSVSFLCPPGKTFSKKETFGAFPLQVQGYSDLHDSLEGAMAQVEIEPVGSEGTHKSGQEVQLIQCLDQT